MIRGVSSSSYSLLWLLMLEVLQIGIYACEFRCSDGTCINTFEICNGLRDCPDGGDETREVCAVLPCRNALGLDELIAEHSFGLGMEGTSVVSSFRCEYGGCITANFKCNGISNCADDSDETAEACKDMNCNANSFRCDYGACISRNKVCDGVKNCHDGSDERPENCKFRVSLRRVVCPRRTKRYCDNRRECYDLREACDGKFDCADKSDENTELCKRPGVVATPPPPTTTTTAPDISIPVMTDPEVDCLSPNCRCALPGLEHFCLPCGEISDLNTTCLSLDNDAVCSLDRAAGVSADVLSCGAQTLMTTAIFSRRGQSCVNRRLMVPTMTLVYADCWGVSSAIMRCHSDGYWRVYGANMSGSDDFDSDQYFMEKQPMKQLCQPYFLNSQVCGKRPRYRSSGGSLDLGLFYLLENRWPMVMGLKKLQRYECSATLISPRFLLTAGHCVIVSQESRNQTMDVRDLRVQLNHYKRDDQRVTEIILHPDYQPGLKPLNDLALIRLEKPILFNSKMYPACVDMEGEGFLSSYSAVTFNRSNGQNEHSYTRILQQIDPGCHYNLDRCQGLEIQLTQFCGVDLEANSQLEGGSSGGPFMQNLGTEDSEEWTVSGVVSFSDHKSTCQLPRTVFTTINGYGTWITDVVHNEI